MSKNSIMRPMLAHGDRFAAGARRYTRGACLALLLAGGVLLGACSQVKLGYGHADTLVMFWANSYVDLDADQEAILRPRLKQLLAWHRATQLQDYARLLEQIEARIDPGVGGKTPVSAAEVIAINSEVQARLLVLSERALPDLADLALSLRPEQIDQIDKKMADNIRKFERDVLSGSDENRMRKRADRAIGRAEDWFGRFATVQRTQLRLEAARHLSSHAPLLEERQRRRQELVETLRRIQKEQPTREATIAALRAYSLTLTAHSQSERHAQQRQRAAGSADLTAAMINTATEAQRTRAAKKLRGWIADFTELAKVPAQQPSSGLAGSNY